MEAVVTFGDATAHSSATSAPTFEEAFPVLLRDAYRVAYRLLGNRTEAEDVAQEACARAYSRWSSVRDHAEPWCVRVASNLALDLLRRRTRSRRHEAQLVAAGTVVPPVSADRPRQGVRPRAASPPPARDRRPALPRRPVRGPDRRPARLLGRVREDPLEPRPRPTAGGAGPMTPDDPGDLFAGLSDDGMGTPEPSDQALATVLSRGRALRRRRRGLYSASAGMAIAAIAIGGVAAHGSAGPNQSLHQLASPTATGTSPTPSAHASTHSGGSTGRGTTVGGSRGGTPVGGGHPPASTPPPVTTACETTTPLPPATTDPSDPSASPTSGPVVGPSTGCSPTPTTSPTPTPTATPTGTDAPTPTTSSTPTPASS
jgi:RNA polymerase sigma factor (sigma-70 family)